MKFADGLIKAYETKWSYINTFSVQFTWSDEVKNMIGWTSGDDYNINLNIINIDTPEFTNQNIEAYIGDRWVIHNGRDELYRFSMTFRDQDQLKYYKMFTTVYLLQKSSYFDDVKSVITLNKDADYIGEMDNTIFQFNDVMIDAVSQLQFNNTTEAQIAEFSVTFKCSSPELNISGINNAR